MFYTKCVGKCKPRGESNPPDETQTRRQLEPSRTPRDVLQYSLGCVQVNGVPNFPNCDCLFWECLKKHYRNLNFYFFFEHITTRGTTKNTSKHSFAAPTSFPVSWVSWDLERKSNSDVCNQTDCVRLWHRKFCTSSPLLLFGSRTLSKYRVNFVSAPSAIFTAVSPQPHWAANHCGCISKGTPARYSPALVNIKPSSFQADCPL